MESKEHKRQRDKEYYENHKEAKKVYYQFKKDSRKECCQYCGKPLKIRQYFFCSLECTKSYKNEHYGLSPRLKREEILHSRCEYRRQYKLRFPEKHKTHRKTQREIHMGRIKRQPCSVCNVSPAHAHHEDYSQPFNIVWLCTKHHNELHQEKIRRLKAASALRGVIQQ